MTFIVFLILCLILVFVILMFGCTGLLATLFGKELDKSVYGMTDQESGALFLKMTVGLIVSLITSAFFTYITYLGLLAYFNN